MDYKQCETSSVKLLGKDDPGGSEYGLLTGYAAIFNNWDRADELITPGAFAPHLPAFLKDGFISMGHDWTKIIASPVSAEEDAVGLRVTGEFHSVSMGQDARAIAAERQARGKSVGLSIGYDVAASEPDAKGGRKGTGGRKLLDLPLYEWSMVTVPCNPRALVTGVKGSLPDGLRFEDHADTTLAIVSDFLERARGLHELRMKAGRTISAINGAKLQAVHLSLQEVLDIMEELLEAAGLTDPNEASESGGKAHPLRDEYVRFLLQEATALGVIV
jgi:HK97 family phage prohead protease